MKLAFCVLFEGLTFKQMRIPELHLDCHQLLLGRGPQPIIWEVLTLTELHP